MFSPGYRETVLVLIILSVNSIGKTECLDSNNLILFISAIIEGVPQVEGFSGDGSVTLMCEMYGYATTSDPITWSNSNGETLTDDTSKFSIMDSEGSKMIIYSNGDTGESIVSVLTINDLTLEDTGNYTCNTENGIERQSATTQVLIYAGTSPPTTSEAPTTTTSPEMIGRYVL